MSYSPKIEKNSLTAHGTERFSIKEIKPKFWFSLPIFGVTQKASILLLTWTIRRIRRMRMKQNVRGSLQA